MAGNIIGLHFMHLSVSSPRGGGGTTHGNLTVAYIPRVGILIGHHAFDLSILCSRREINHLFLLILTILFCPGVGILIIFFRKCKNPHPIPDPPPLGLDTDRCIKSFCLYKQQFNSGTQRAGLVGITCIWQYCSNFRVTEKKTHSHACSLL